MKKISISLLLILLIGLLWPQNLQMPVEGATSSDYNPETFWYYPWGKSVTHKGVDIFARQGRAVYAATSGLVLSAGEIARGGKYVLVLGPKWRLHYYAHLHAVHTTAFSWVDKQTKIATVGATGNAAGKQPHLHYAIMSMLPYPWRIDSSRQGWKKMFYLNPIDYF